MKTRTRVTVGERNAMRALRALGVTCTDISKITGRSVSNVVYATDPVQRAIHNAYQRGMYRGKKEANR